MNAKLQEERAKALELLRTSKSNQRGEGFNLSDLKSDKTMYFESPQNSYNNNFNKQRSPFEPSEISARSTIHKNAPSKNFIDMDFDEIMRTSVSADVRSKYRESIGTRRFSSIPRTADMSLRTSYGSSSDQKNCGNDFWNAAKVSANSFNGQNMSVTSDDFRPAEEMSQQLKEDEMEQEQEFASIPNVQPVADQTTWEERTSRQPEMSFGAYCQDFLPNIRDLYSNKSPAKRNNRVAMVDVTNDEDSPSASESSRLGMTHIQMLLKNFDTPKAQAALLNHGKGVNRMHDNIRKQPHSNKQDGVISGINEMINSLNFDKIVELTQKETERMRAEKENMQDVPVRDRSQFQVPNRSQHHDVTITPPSPKVQCMNAPEESFPREDNNAIPGRGLKRRSSSVSNDTPLSALDKCMRSKSPARQIELKAAAATLLKPKIDDVFKVPNGGGSRANVSSFNKSTANSSRQARLDTLTSSQSSLSRDYLTAVSMNSISDKLSLPVYGLSRPENTFTSPTSSARSNSRMSPNFPQEGQLKRTVSQLSAGSEFQEDVLPLKIKKANRKLSWESVKLYQEVTRSITIQNGSTKKLPLRVKIQGAGFTVCPREDFRMIPQEVRNFEVKFSPTVVGPSHGELTFELATNSKCSISIPLFAYGGHTSLRMDGVQKGPIGPAFITMGPMKSLNGVMEQQLRLTNHGTLPGFALLAFEKTKWSDFSLSQSLHTSPSEVRLHPGESANIKIRFKATKEEIKKIFSLNKEITIVGEICILTGDEPTRLRLLKNKEIVPQQFLKYLPKKLYNDEEFKRELMMFNENLDRGKLSTIMEQIKTHEIALTINRNLDETQIIAAELSMTDDNMSFMTFCETNYTHVNVNDAESDDEMIHENNEYLECSLFRVRPAQVIFNRRTDKPETPKFIVIESTDTSDLFAEALSSRREVITAVKSCGVIKPGESVEVKICPKLRAFQNPYVGTVYVSLIINNGRVEIPVKFVD